MLRSKKGPVGGASLGVALAAVVVGVSPVFAQGPWVAGDLGLLGGTVSNATDVNDAGLVVGGRSNGVSQSAFVWTSAVGATDLGTLGGSSTVAWAISDCRRGESG